MLRTPSRHGLAWAAAASFVLMPLSLHAQETAPAAEGPIVSSQIQMSRDGAAELQLELSGGRTLDLALTENGDVRMNGERIGRYEQGDALFESWRALLRRAMDVSDGELAGLLVGWSPPDNAAGRRLDRELEGALEATGPVAPVAEAPAAQESPAANLPQSLDEAQSSEDSIRLLNERLQLLEKALEDVDADIDLSGIDVAANPDEIRIQIEHQLREQLRTQIREELRDQFRPQDALRGPLHYFTRGLSGILSTLMLYAVLVGLGFLAVFFGKGYLEGVADTARHATLRSLLVGLAGTFLVLPGYILGMIALAISIVGIPLLLVWAPLFPVAVGLAAVLGYLAVAHAGGEALAERRFEGGDWFKRANSYYYMITGVGLLMVLFLAAHIIGIAGPWLGFLKGLLTFVGGVVTWAAFTIGFGAVLISRGGKRPVGANGATAAADTGDDIHV